MASRSTADYAAFAAAAVGVTFALGWICSRIMLDRITLGGFDPPREHVLGAGVLFLIAIAPLIAAVIPDGVFERLMAMTGLLPTQHGTPAPTEVPKGIAAKTACVVVAFPLSIVTLVYAANYAYGPGFPFPRPEIKCFIGALLLFETPMVFFVLARSIPRRIQQSYRLIIDLVGPFYFLLTFSLAVLPSLSAAFGGPSLRIVHFNFPPESRLQGLMGKDDWAVLYEDADSVYVMAVEDVHEVYSHLIPNFRLAKAMKMVRKAGTAWVDYRSFEQERKPASAGPQVTAKMPF